MQGTIKEMNRRIRKKTTLFVSVLFICPKAIYCNIRGTMYLAKGSKTTANISWNE